MNDEGHYSFSFLVTKEMLLSTSTTEDDRIDCFKVRWVCKDSLSELVAIRVGFGECCA